VKPGRAICVVVFDDRKIERRAWATVNKETGGGKASASRPAAARLRSAKKAAATRKRNTTARSGTRKAARKK
jgi:hypothetical protein